ncbi:MAG: type II 3-dehydroquinate dehydratase [Rhodanobacter sp.]
MAKILVLSGPNLNLPGTREPHIYGHETLAGINQGLAERAQAAGRELVWFQSNAEHELTGRIDQAREDPPFRHHPYLSDLAIGVICGFGSASCGLALEATIQRLRAPAAASV